MNRPATARANATPPAPAGAKGALQAEYDLQRKYDHFNALLFNGALPTIPLSFAALKDVGGRVKYKLRRTGPPPDPLRIRLGLAGRHDNAELIPGSMHLQLSSLFRRSEQRLDALLVHEMIHVALLAAGNLSDNHGLAFLAEATRCGRIVGFTIPLTDTVAGRDLTDPTAKPIGVLLLRKKDGTHHAALLPDKVIRASLEAIQQRWGHMLKYGYAEAATAYSVTAPGWTHLAARRRVPRKFDCNTPYYPGITPELVEELQKVGTVLLAVAPDPQDDGTAE